jgi:uncharacterized protein
LGFGVMKNVGGTEGGVESMYSYRIRLGIWLHLWLLNWVDFEWDENRRLWTLSERGLDFREVRHLFDVHPLDSYPSPREGEDRIVSVGLLAGRMLTVVWIDRDGSRRVISMRRARDAEEKQYRSLFG